MKPYKRNYIKHFDLTPDDFIYCEVAFILYGACIRGDDLHHITYKSQLGTDNITNLMAVSRKEHNEIHEEKYTKEYLQDIHNRFLVENPYC